jgi:hypothetical protein
MYYTNKYIRTAASPFENCLLHVVILCSIVCMQTLRSSTVLHYYILFYQSPPPVWYQGHQMEWGLIAGRLAHRVFKWLKPAKNKFTWCDFTNFSKSIISNLSNCCKYKCDHSISQIFTCNFCRVFVIWNLCVAGWPRIMKKGRSVEAERQEGEESHH